MTELTIKLPGFNHPRKAWVQLNRLRTVFGRFASNTCNIVLANINLCKCVDCIAEHVLQNSLILRTPYSLEYVTNDNLAFVFRILYSMSKKEK